MAKPTELNLTSWLRKGETHATQIAHRFTLGLTVPVVFCTPVALSRQITTMNKTLLLALVAAPFALAHAEDAKPEVWIYKGAFEAYYGSSNPSTGAGTTRGVRQFDLSNDQLRIADFQLSVGYRASLPGFGFSLTAFAGDNSDILWLSETSSNGIDRRISEGYVTWKDPTQTLQVDFGKFYSFIGYESAESWNSDLYSRGLLYTITQPVYHAGLRISKQVNAKTGVSVYATNGWNQIERRTAGLSYGLQVRHNFSDKIAVTASGLFGYEGSNVANHGGSFGGVGYPTAGAVNTSLGDLIVTYDPNAKWHYALNGTYGTANGSRWEGVSFIAKYKLCDTLSFAIRGESVNDEGGLRLGIPASVSGLTLGVDYTLDAHSLIRLELRKDQSNGPIFRRADGSNANDQSTINLAYTLKF